MKKTIQTKRPLTFAVETIRTLEKELSDKDLAAVAGGRRSNVTGAVDGQPCN